MNEEFAQGHIMCRESGLGKALEIAEKEMEAENARFRVD